MALTEGVEDTSPPEDTTGSRLGDVQIGLPDADTEDELDIDQVFELLKNERRREIITFLKHQDDHVSTSDGLAEHIAALENDVEISELSSTQRKRVYIALYQCHLPKMDRFGVIDFDKQRGTVELRNTTSLDPFLPGSASGSSDRLVQVLAVSVAVIVGIGLTGIGILAAVPGVLWTVLGVGALLVVAFAKI